MLNISNYESVFCDSYDALISAYKHGLNRNANIYSNAPAVIMQCNDSIYIEDYWSREKLKIFQSSINSYSIKLFDKLKENKCIGHEESLVVLQSFVNFQKVIYKSACLTEIDIQEPRLIIEVEGYGGANGNNMNTPWSYLLQDNKALGIYSYRLPDSNWQALSTKGISIWSRIKLGGIETIVYRIISRISKYLPKRFIRGIVLVPSENELVIEACAHLVKHRIFPVELTSKGSALCSSYSDNIDIVKKCISEIISQRVNEYVCSTVSIRCIELFYQNLEKNLLSFYNQLDIWRNTLDQYDNTKSIVLANSLASPSLTALSKVCTDKNIPVVTAQHGITAEINALHSCFTPVYESNYSDLFMAYNNMSKIVSDSSYYRKGDSCISGISSRHLRVKERAINFPNNPSLVYVSNNLYTGNMNGVANWLTDLEQCKNEIEIISNVLSKLSCNVTYKTYPEENRRYSDLDPVFSEINKFENIKVMDEKVDMRFLLPNYDLIMSTTASSTLAWLILTEKPFIYIYRSSHAPLNKDAYSEFSKSIFLFNADKEGYADEILSLLSQPYEKIISQWIEMRPFRLSMIKKYVSLYNDSPGGRISHRLLSDYF